MSDKARSHASRRLAKAMCDDYATRTFEPGTHCIPLAVSCVIRRVRPTNSKFRVISFGSLSLQYFNKKIKIPSKSYGAPEPVSEHKTINDCFSERCPTKQGVTRAADLRRRSATTMRLGRSNPGPTAYRLRYLALFVVSDQRIANSESIYVNTSSTSYFEYV